MGYELLERVTALLQGAGLQAGEEYPGFGRPSIETPWAAVGLLELKAAEGIVRFRVRILSPRILGGWCCQRWAARAVQALNEGGMTCAGEEMEYLSGSDCFCVALTASMDVVSGPEGWVPGRRWTILCGDAVQEGVESFRAERDQQRRLVGAHWAYSPVAVTPGRDGWKLELVQLLTRETEEPEEPFVLTVREGDRTHRYTGCCWNEIRYAYTQAGLRLTRRGFALGREEEENG